MSDDPRPFSADLPPGEEPTAGSREPAPAGPPEGSSGAREGAESGAPCGDGPQRAEDAAGDAAGTDGPQREEDSADAAAGTDASQRAEDAAGDAAGTDGPQRAEDAADDAAETDASHHGEVAVAPAPGADRVETPERDDDDASTAPGDTTGGSADPAAADVPGSDPTPQSEAPGSAMLSPGGDEAAEPTEELSGADRRAREAAEFVRQLSRGAVPDALEPGMEVRGVVAGIEGDEAHVEVGDAFRGLVNKLDFVDESGRIRIELGDVVSLVVVSTEEPIRFKRKITPIAKAIGAVAEAFTSGEPIEGEITASVKGGFEVKVAGLRTFCPSSHAGNRRGGKPPTLVGQKLPFLITKFDPSGRSIVVSRRKLLDRERKQRAREVKARIHVGARFKGRVVAVQPYGAFVDLGGLQGLLHVSEVSHSRVAKADDVLKVGQEIDVQVIDHDEPRKRISLSAKVLVDDPWLGFGEATRPGQVLRARVLRKVKSGAIVELAPGVEARLHGSELPAGADSPPAEAGTELDVQVVRLDTKRHRAVLLSAPAGAEPGSVPEPPEVRPSAKIKGIVERVAPFGVFVALGPGKTGLVHATETGTPPGTDLATAFPAGTPLQVEVLEVDAEADRIRLSCRSAAERARAAAARPQGRGRGGPPGQRGQRSGRGGPRRGEPLSNPAAAPKGSGFASFGDVLRSQLQAATRGPSTGGDAEGATPDDGGTQARAANAAAREGGGEPADPAEGGTQPSEAAPGGAATEAEGPAGGPS